MLGRRVNGLDRGAGGVAQRDGAFRPGAPMDQADFKGVSLPVVLEGQVLGLLLVLDLGARVYELPVIGDANIGPGKEVGREDCRSLRRTDSGRPSLGAEGCRRASPCPPRRAPEQTVSGCSGDLEQTPSATDGSSGGCGATVCSAFPERVVPPAAAVVVGPSFARAADQVVPHPDGVAYQTGPVGQVRQSPLTGLSKAPSSAVGCGAAPPLTACPVQAITTGGAAGRTPQ